MTLRIQSFYAFVVSVLHRRADYLEASFHVALDYDPDIKFKVELVLENKLTPASIRKAERSSRNRHPRYSLETCSAATSVHQPSGHHTSSGQDNNNASSREGLETGTVSAAGFTVSINLASELQEDFQTETDAKNPYRNNHATITGRLPEHLSENVREGHIEHPTAVSQHDVEYHLTGENQHGTGYRSENGKTEAETDNPSQCHQSINARRRRLVGRRHEYEVFDATRSFVSWWADCSNQRQRQQQQQHQQQQLHNGGDGNKNFSSCMATMKLARSRWHVGPAAVKEADFIGDALLIIYKNVAADLVRTRRALKQGLESRAADRVTSTNVGESMDEGGRVRHKRKADGAVGRVDINATKEIRKLTRAADEEEDTMCRIKKWYIDFEQMGWTWIIAPTVFEANFCTGSCEADLQTINRLSFTNNAFLRSAYRLFTKDETIPNPTCVPIRTSAMNILYRSDDETIVLRRVSEITADRCGCL